MTLKNKIVNGLAGIVLAAGINGCHNNYTFKNKTHEQITEDIRLDLLGTPVKTRESCFQGCDLDSHEGYIAFTHEGKLGELVLCVKGKLNGPYISWYPNGHKRFDLNFKDNKSDGLNQYWSLIEEQVWGDYTLPKRHIIEWYKEGKIIERTTLIDGKEVLHVSVSASYDKYIAEKEIKLREVIVPDKKYEEYLVQKEKDNKELRSGMIIPYMLDVIICRGKKPNASSNFVGVTVVDILEAHQYFSLPERERNLIRENEDCKWRQFGIYDLNLK
jgi:hypothetical protein